VKGFAPKGVVTPFLPAFRDAVVAGYENPAEGQYAYPVKLASRTIPTSRGRPCWWLWTKPPSGRNLRNVLTWSEKPGTVSAEHQRAGGDAGESQDFRPA